MEFPPSMSPMESQRKALPGSFNVCANLGIFNWRLWNLGSPGTVPRNWVQDYVFNSYYKDKR